MRKTHVEYIYLQIACLCTYRLDGADWEFG